MSGSKTISTSDTKLEALSLQSSAYGVTVPLLYGMNRIAGNMVWYGGFKATAHTTSQSSGKGGGVKTQNTTYTYSASVMMGLCEGQITGIPRIWKGKQLYSGGATAGNLATVGEPYTVPTGGGTFTVAHSAAFAANIGVSVPGTGSGDIGDNGWTLAEGVHYTRVGGVYTFPAGAADGLTVTVTYQYTYGSIPQTAMAQLGLSFATGALGQATWAYLTTNFSAQAIGYSGLAMVYAQDYALGTSAQVDNHTFEVMGPQAYSISSTIPDANPASAAWDALVNGRYGAAFPSGMLENVTPWSSYCLASGLLLSPALETQIQASEFVATMGTLTNTAPVWSGGKLKMIPYGDVTLTANGATYTPNTTPIYDLTDDDYLGGGDPIMVSRKPQADAYNHIRIEFVNRANLYNVEIAEAKDSANIDANGLRSASIFSAHWICDASIARTVAQIMLQRAVYVRNTYTFTLAWTKALLEPMDLVTLTDSGLGFNKLPVRIIEIAESENGDLAVVAEEYPQGVASATLYATQSGGGFQHDYNAAPGSIAAPMIFEAPGALAQNGLEIYVAATGTGASWGGCNVWVSLDGTNYKNIGTLNGGSRYGTLSAACGASGTISVALNSGVLASGSVADAAALNTLCYIGGAAKEFFAFNTATLTSALHYDLAGSSVRGAYVTAAASHSIGDPFARIDTAIAKSGVIDLGYVGKTIHIKCTSFNIYGANEESLASVTDYTYTLTGTFVTSSPTRNTNISITSGAITGIGTGAGTVVDNTQITVTGGAVTGIGAGSGTVVDNALLVPSITNVQASEQAIGITALQIALSDYNLTTRMQWQEAVTNATITTDAITGQIQLLATAIVTTDVSSRLSAVEVLANADHGSLVSTVATVATQGGNLTTAQGQITTLSSQVALSASQVYVDSSVANATGALTVAAANAASVLGQAEIQAALDIFTHGGALNTLTANVATAQQQIQANADALASEVVSRSALVATTAANGAAIISEASARTSADTAIANSVTALTAVVATANAAISTEQTTRASADTALASSISSVSAAAVAAQSDATTALNNSATNSSNITTEATARASADSTNASAITAISARLNTGDFASVATSASASASAVTGLQAKYVVTVDVNGNISGIQIASGAGGSSFTVLADQFLLVKPGSTPGTPVQMFTVGTVAGVTQVGIHGNLVVDGSIATAAIGNGQVSANIAVAGTGVPGSGAVVTLTASGGYARISFRGTFNASWSQSSPVQSFIGAIAFPITVAGTLVKTVTVPLEAHCIVYPSIYASKRISIPFEFDVVVGPYTGAVVLGSPTVATTWWTDDSGGNYSAPTGLAMGPSGEYDVSIQEIKK